MSSRLQKRAQAIASEYEQTPTIGLSPKTFDAEHGLIRSFLYYLMSAWIISGVADWWWHKQTDIEHTSGLKESMIHALMFIEVGIPILLGLTFRINAGSLLLMWVTALVHEWTVIWDVDVASRYREVAPREQHTHSFLEITTLTACMIASCLHWDQLRSLVGLGQKKPDFRLRSMGMNCTGAGAPETRGTTTRALILSERWGGSAGAWPSLGLDYIAGCGWSHEWAQQIWRKLELCPHGCANGPEHINGLPKRVGSPMHRESLRRRRDRHIEQTISV